MRSLLTAAAICLSTGAALAARPAGFGPDAAAQAVADGVSALSETPPKREGARRAFERAIAGGGDAATASLAYLQLGMLDEAELNFPAALAHYRACVEAKSSGRSAHIARGRIAWIDPRSEGGFAPLVALQRVRSDPALRDDPKMVDRLALEAESFPPGLVRSEARIFVGETWLKDRARRGDAIAELRKAVDDPSVRTTNVRFAARDLVEALLADKRLDEAASVVGAHPFDPKATEEVQRLLRRRSFRRAASVGLLAALAVLVAARLRKSRRRAATPARDSATGKPAPTLPS